MFQPALEPVSASILTGICPTFSQKAEAVEESYHWWLNKIEYVLTKVYPVPAGNAPAQEIPDLDALSPLAPFWVLHIRAQVESSPERLQNGQDQLAQLQKQLIGIFDFKAFDRRAYDTRSMDGPRN